MNELISITAKTSCPQPPEWAVLQRRLFVELEAALDVYIAKYAREDGSLVYAEKWTNDRDGLDDLYEAFYNIPLLYLLGGSSRLLELAHFHWEAITHQATEYGLVKDEYELGYDHFHQSEGNLFFVHLCAADPKNPKLLERARRFADLYLSPPNYDPELNIIRAIHTGSGGPRWGFLDEHDIFTPFMEHFGLAYHDFDGIESFEDVANWNEGEPFESNRARMKEAMEQRMGRGESISNMLATCIVTNGYLMTGDEAYKTWIEKYTQGWWDRAAEHGGIVPDNTGVNGAVGHEMNGNWYGAAYGWSWPLGYDYLCDFIDVAANNATLVTGKTDWFGMPGTLFDTIFEKAQIVPDYRVGTPPRPEQWVVEATEEVGNPSALVAPKKYGNSGWMANYPFLAGPVVGSWYITFNDEDRKRIDGLRHAEPHDWNTTYTFRSKCDDGHERSWFAYQVGDYPNYPEEFLHSSLNIVAQRLDGVINDTSDLTKINIHHWQNNNPVTTEALVQLTLGGPQQRYCGGPYRTCFRYFDELEGRPGLPNNVSALVEKIEADSATVTFVNVSTTTNASVKVQGGFYGEHVITQVLDTGSDAITEVNASLFCVNLPPQSSIRIQVSLKRYANMPYYA